MLWWYKKNRYERDTGQTWYGRAMLVRWYDQTWYGRAMLVRWYGAMTYRQGNIGTEVHLYQYGGATDSCIAHNHVLFFFLKWRSLCKMHIVKAPVDSSWSHFLVWSTRNSWVLYCFLMLWETRVSQTLIKNKKNLWETTQTNEAA